MSMLRPSILRTNNTERSNFNVLVLGCAGTGKTLLLRHLKRE